MGRAPSCDKNGLKKGPWTTEEDQKLVGYIQENGIGNWRTLPKNAGLQRCGKSCRLRWTNYLRPDIKRGKFSVEEEETIIQLHSILGNKWSAIAARLPGRTDNEIKNYWNTNIRKKLLRMGIDPVTHTDILETVMSSSLSCCNDSSFISTLLGVRAIINPNLMRWLLPNQSGYDQGFLTHNNQSSHQLLNDDMNQIRTVSGQLCTEMQTLPPLSSSSSVQGLSASTTFHDNPHQLLQCGIGSQDQFCQVTSNIDSDQWLHYCNNWPMFYGDEYVPLTTDYGCYAGSDQPNLMEDPNLSNNIQASFSFQSIFSSPWSMPKLELESRTEDERGSYYMQQHYMTKYV